MPASSTPTTSRERSSTSGLPGNSEAVCASGPSPSSSRSQRGSPPRCSRTDASYDADPASGPSSPSIRITVGRWSLLSRPISESFAIRKFDSPSSAGTQRSSLNHTVARLQSTPARDAIS